MFDPIGFVVTFIRNYMQRIQDIFSFILLNYFPTEEDEEEQDEGFASFRL